MLTVGFRKEIPRMLTMLSVMLHMLNFTKIIQAAKITLVNIFNYLNSGD